MEFEKGIIKSIIDLELLEDEEILEEFIEILVRYRLSTVNFLDEYLAELKHSGLLSA